MVGAGEWLKVSTSSKGVVDGFALTMSPRGNRRAERVQELLCERRFNVKVSGYLAETSISEVLRGWNSVNSA